MERWVGKVAVVTGASAGIGEAIAKDLVRSGLQVVGLARRKSRMEALSLSLKGEKGKFHAYECDISSEKSIQDAFLWIMKTFGGVHALINNAGLCIPGTIINIGTEDIRKTFDVNVMGLLYCTQEALRIMKDRNIEGTIININSIQGHRVYQFPGVQLNVYPASKHAVTAIVEGLQHELRDMNLKVRVTSLSPGFVATEIASANNIPIDISQLVHLAPEDIASAVAYILSTPQNVQITELTIRPLGEKC